MVRIADDFGLGRRHDKVILSLLEAGRLDGTSVMVNEAIDPSDIKRLRDLRRAGSLVGLHLNLTQAFPKHGPVWPLATLMNIRLPDGVAASLDRQMEEFVALFGSLPDYYDGHQHCHCFPAIAPLVTRLSYGPKTWVRVPLPATWAGRWGNVRAGGAKVLAIMAFAARAKTVFTQAGLLTNADFSGFLRLDDPKKVRLWLPRLLSAAGPDCLMMLHPGDATDLMQCSGHAPESRAAETEILMESATA
ncbi:ChbG/HpnK family deacetylase [Pseudaminobacter soli (ex Li et al. 2025)]|uniref:Amino acid dehydrogenase n=1 Tax=Pseudaminobacter soli (ex Li et al. 2025) TaxID=1295366 RepID=A0A2P7RVM1_9HYPH|nr:ChbG/HpnK family deacetylase [Mesorhizobium soli]PSJ54274.1 amino acid dehydrogenase [Mesorhizobium soli]